MFSRRVAVRRPASLSRGLLRARVELFMDALTALARQSGRMVLHTLRFGDWRPMELFTATLATSWGLWFLVSPWSVMDANAAYVVMRAVAAWFGLTGDGLWGFLLLIGGIVQCIGFYTEHARTARAAALHLTGVWTFMGWCWIAADFRLLATITLPLYVACSMWVYYRVTQAEKSRTARQAAPYRRRQTDRDEPPT